MKALKLMVPKADFDTVLEEIPLSTSQGKLWVIPMTGFF